MAAPATGQPPDGAELHRRFEDAGEGQGSDKEVVGTAAATTKVHTSVSINETTNYSGQDIPSQTMGSDLRAYMSIGAKNNGSTLWRDEVEIIEDKTRGTYEDNVNSQRVNTQTIVPTRVDKEVPKDAEKVEVTNAATTPKMQGNGTVNPCATREVFLSVEGVTMDVSAREQVDNVDVEVLQEIVRSDIQTVGGKPLDPNVTVTSANRAIVNPSLESILKCNLGCCSNLWALKNKIPLR
ncbi:hypothetical protein A4A49_65481 [Nicotiana attenuata]|uniref:Uncharacterized protein n=1 Tax=Nicotiana attenuata TaxID=49451 RepID=A0A1J6JP02_NICAT|nr:hypothetical protein A4A49_13448 [Nicotiana attenuata]OIT39059.1 hypothetical protein A4A49_65481 [Nicotiana attenuata]